MPYEVDGNNAGELNLDDYMLLSGSANRAKSWSCEQCENWNNQKDRNICLSCYWAFPESYNHIAMKQIRRTDLIWQGEEIAIYEKLKLEATALDEDIQETIKKILERNII
ncbi:MAG: HNH nuclease [Legionellales bacterium]|nr:HNH nuclease [Legionellales bacterium]